MYRYQKGQELHSPRAQRNNFQNFGQFQVKRCSELQQAQQWFGVQYYNQNMSACQWSGKRNYTGINSNQQFQNQAYMCNVMQKRYPRKNGSNRRYYPSSHQVRNFNEVGNVEQRLESEQLAYDRNEVMKNIYRVKGASGVRQCQQQSLERFLSGKGNSNIHPYQNSGNSKHANCINMGNRSNSARKKTDSSKITKHVDTQKWMKFSQMKGDLKYGTDTKQSSEQDTSNPACVFVTVSCAELNDGESCESKHCTSQISEQEVGARNIDHVNETKPPGMKTSTCTSTVTEDLQHLNKKTIPGCYDSNPEENYKQGTSNWGSSTFAVKNYLISQMHPKSVVSNIDNNDKCQQRDVKKTAATDLVNEFVKHSHRASTDSAVNSLSEQVEIRRNNGNGNHFPPDELDTRSFDKKQDEIPQVETFGNISKAGDNVGSTKETTKGNDKQIPANQLPSKDMNKKMNYPATPVFPSSQKTDRMDLESVSTETEASAGMERYNNINLKTKLGKKATNERNQMHEDSSKMRTNQNRNESKKEIFVSNQKPGEITNNKCKNWDETLNGKLGKTKLEHKENLKCGKNYLFTQSKDYGKIEKGGGTTLKYHNKYTESLIKPSEVDKENRSVTNTKDEQKKAYVTEKHIVGTNISKKARVDKGDENLFSRINEMIDRANNVKEFVQAKTGGNSERLPFSPNQLVNREESLKKVKFNDDVISVDGNGKISKKKIEDSKSYRLSISLIEMRRKLMKSKRKDHAKSKIQFKQKLAMESEELIKLDKNVSKFKGFKIPKHCKSENNMENLEVIHEVSGKKALEKISDIKSKRHLEQKENANTKAVNSVRETKGEKVNSDKESERESRLISENEESGHVNTQKKRNMTKENKLSDLKGKYFKEPLKLENTKKAECMMDKSLPHTKKVFNKKVLERPSDLKCRVKGNKNVLTEFQDSYHLQTKKPDESKCCGTDNNDSNKSDCQGKRYAENSTTLSENDSGEKDVTFQKQQNTKYKRIRVITDSDEESPKVPKDFAKPRNKKSRLSVDDVKRALGAFSYQAGTAEKIKITEKKGLKQCFPNSLIKENKSSLKKNKSKKELNQSMTENKALKPTCSKVSSNRLKGMHSVRVKLSIHSDANRKKKTKGVKKFDKSMKSKKNELNRAADNEPSIATHIETEKSTALDVEKENGITNVPVNRKEKETKTDSCALKGEKYAYNRNNDKKKVDETYEKVNVKGEDIDSKLPTVAKENLANKTTHRINNFVTNSTKNPTKDKDVSKIPNIKKALNSKQQNEMEVSNSDKVGYQGQFITKLEKGERRKSSVPDKTVKPPVNVQNEVGDLRVKRKANTLFSKKGTEKGDVCTRKVNLLEKKSLGYTAPGVKRKNLGSMPISSSKNAKSVSAGNTRDDKRDKIKKDQNKHLKSVSDIVAQKLTELKAKADELMCKDTSRDCVMKADERMCKGTTGDSVIKSNHKTDMNRNYCNRSRLDGDRVTSHLFRPDKTNMSERSNSISNDVYKLKNQNEENILPGNEEVGFPITVLNTRTPTVQSIESEEEMQDTEQVKPDKFITPVQPYKDYSLPEHNKCLYNMKIRDRTALYAANLPDLETFGRDKQHVTPVEQPHSNQTELKSVYGDRACNLRNDSVIISALQQPRNLNLSWQDIFPVPDYYFKMKNAFEGINVNGKERQAIVNVTDTKDWTESENPSTSTAGDMSQASSYNNSISEVGQTVKPMPHSAQQINPSNTTCQLTEGPYIAYPLGNVTSFLNNHVDNGQYQKQTLPLGFPRDDNFGQTGHVHYNTPNQAGILTNYNKFPQTDTYHQGSNSCQNTQNVAQYSHGMPPSNDSKLFHVSGEDQPLRNGSYISPFSCQTQKEDVQNRNKVSSNHEQMQCSYNSVQPFGKQQSTGWNPKIPLINVSFNEACTNETSVYMQSVIVQHKTINRSSSESYSRRSNETDVGESTWPVHSTQRCQNDTSANLHSDVYENSAFDANVVVSDSSSLTRGSGFKIEEYQVEEQKSLKKPRLDMNNNFNDAKEAESGNAHILLVDTSNVSECKLQSSTSCNETRKEGQALNEKEQLKDSDTQENLTSGCSSTLLDNNEAPMSSNEPALSSCSPEKEMILDESTGQFRSVEIAVEILQSPKVQTDSVFEILDTEDHCTDQIGSSNSASGNSHTSNASLSNCKVDPQVKGRMKYPLVMLSPLKMTKELEDMIDDCITKNSSMFDSTSLPIFHSPLFSIETPSITPRNTPTLALSHLSPPVLSPYGLPKANENIVYEKQNKGTIKQTFDIKKQVKKKKKETRSKMLKNILPTRQYDREKTLFETAEMFLGEDFTNKSTRKRKRTERMGIEIVKTNKKTKPDLEKKLTENEEISDEISEHVKELKQLADDFERCLKQKDTDTKSYHETSNKTHYKNNFPIEVDTRQLKAEKFRDCEVNDETEKRKRSSDETSDEEDLPLIQRLLMESAKELKYPDTLKKASKIIETKVCLTKDKYKGTSVNKEEGLHADAASDEKELNCEKVLLKKKGKKATAFDKQNVNSNKHKVSDTVSENCEELECDMIKESVLDSKNSTQQENNVKLCKESKTQDHEKSGVSGTAYANLESTEEVKSVNAELASEQTTQISSETKLDRSIIVAKKDGQWTVSTTKKKRGKSNANRLQKTIEAANFSSKAGDDLEKVKNTQNEDEAKCPDNIVKGSKVDQHSKVNDTEITDKIDIKQCDSTRDSGILETDKKEQQEVKGKGRKRKQRKLKKPDNKAHQLESEEKSTSITKDETRSKIQEFQSSKVDKVIDTESEKLRSDMEPEDTTKTVLGKRQRTCKLNSKSNTDENDIAVKKKQATDKSLKEGKEDKKNLDMKKDHNKSDNLKIYENNVTVVKKNKPAGEGSNVQNNLSSAVSPKINTHDKKSKKRKYSKNSKEVLEFSSLDTVLSTNYRKKDTNIKTANKTSTKKEALKRKKMVSDHLKKYSSKSVPIKNRAKTEVKASGEKDDGQTKCGICDEQFMEKDQLNSHTLICHPHRCKWCKVDFDSKEASKEHYFSHMKTTYHCYTCNMKYGNPATYEQHMKSNRHKQKIEKCKEIQTSGQSTVIHNSMSNQTGRYPAVPIFENFVIEVENMDKPVVDQWLPENTVSQFYSSLQQTSQTAWCDYSISNNNVELHYNHADFSAYGNEQYPQFAANSNAAYPNAAVAYQGGHLNNRYLPDGTQVGLGQQFGVPATDINMIGFDQGFVGNQSNGSMIDNSSVFVENGKVYTKMTDVKVPEGVHHRMPDGSVYTEMTNEDVVDTDQHSETSTLCRIANSFSLSPFVTQK